MNTNEQQFHHPNKNANKRTALMVLGISSLFCALLIAFLFVISKQDATSNKHIQSDDIIDLLNSPQQHADSVDINSTDIGIELPLGGWIQQTDSLGNLVQQYRCEALDPNPPDLPNGWIEMTQPEVELYLGDNKLVRITGDSGIANAPKRILESGEISGHVEVKMFAIDEVTKLVNPIPLMELHTLIIYFDNFIGEISCPSEVRITSPSQSLLGRNLSIRFNDLEERIEYLHLAELDYIKFIPAQTEKHSTVQPEIETLGKSTGISPMQRHVKPAIFGEDIEYYIVTLSDNVKVLQGNQDHGRLATGNKLTIAFSNKSKTTSEETRSNSERLGPMQPQLCLQTIPAAIVATSLAFVQPSLDQETVKITCDGGLLMVPLDDPSLIPSTPTDTRIELFAFDDAPAQIIDTVQGMTAYGSLLRYELAQDRSDLFGTPATLLMNDMLTSSNHFWIASQDGQGGAEGEGSMVSVTAQPSSTTLQWSEGVDFSFDPIGSDGQGALNEVICHGNVVLTDQGSVINCETLTVTFTKGPDGSSSPSLAVATGNVKATSETQTLWANEAEVSFSNSADSSSSEDDSMFGGSQADKLLARGDVQVLLEDGGRAFCNTLSGDIAQDTISLHGDVFIAYERMVMNRGEEASLTLDRASGKGKWNGPGQALFLETPLDVSPDRRIERPIIQPPTNSSKGTEISMRANWNRTMNIDQTFNAGAGAIDLAGHVNVQSQRTPFERSQMTGEDLRLEFVQPHKDSNNTTRELHKVIARDQAQIEHRTWDALYPNLPPVVYYIGGNHLEFDVITREALAVGNGELVLRDPRSPHNEVHQSALAGRGTTRFTWENKLKTTRLHGNVYRLEMTGNVEMVHKGLDGSIGMLTSDKIEAIAIDPEVMQLQDTHGAQLTLRGMDLQQLNATGSVYVATETRRVDCDKFEYNLKTGFAKLTAKDDNTVAVVTEGTPYPVRASSIIWNMDPAVDTITIRNLQGTSSN